MHIGKIIAIMEAAARKKEAPVFSLEAESASTPFQILVATMLSARTKDETTIAAMKKLFKKAKTPQAMLKLTVKQIEQLIYGVGFYRVKAANLRKMSSMLIRRFHGFVPNSIEQLLQLPGVGRKTANIVLSRAFGRDTLGVDVHVHRISNRLGLVKTSTPEQTEAELLRIVPRKYIKRLNRAFVGYGQTVCKPVNPLCGVCKLNKICCKGKSQ